MWKGWDSCQHGTRILTWEVLERPCHRSPPATVVGRRSYDWKVVPPRHLKTKNKVFTGAQMLSLSLCVPDDLSPRFPAKKGEVARETHQRGLFNVSDVAHTYTLRHTTTTKKYLKKCIDTHTQLLNGSLHPVPNCRLILWKYSPFFFSLPGPSSSFPPSF